MSPLAPEAAAPSEVRAAPAVVAAVPPCATLSGVVRPVSDVMSPLAPEAAALIVVRTDAPVVAVTMGSAKVEMPRFSRAPEAVIEPVPPCATVTGSDSEVGSEARTTIEPLQ